MQMVRTLFVIKYPADVPETEAQRIEVAKRLGSALDKMLNMGDAALWVAAPAWLDIAAITLPVTERPSDCA
jgi:hypothetical protein